MFLGCSFLGLDAIPYPKTNNEEMKKMILNNSAVDAVHIEKYTGVEDDYYEIPGFNWNTIFSADFNSNLTAGNTDWILNKVKELNIKKREKGTFDCITIQH